MFVDPTWQYIVIEENSWKPDIDVIAVGLIFSLNVAKLVLRHIFHSFCRNNNRIALWFLDIPDIGPGLQSYDDGNMTTITATSTCATVLCFMNETERSKCWLQAPLCDDNNITTRRVTEYIDKMTNRLRHIALCLILQRLLAVKYTNLKVNYGQPKN